MKITIYGLLVALALVPNITFAQTPEVDELRQQLIVLLLEKVQLLQEKLELVKKLESIETTEQASASRIEAVEEVQEVDQDVLQFKCTTNWYMDGNKVREICKQYGTN